MRKNKEPLLSVEEVIKLRALANPPQEMVKRQRYKEYGAFRKKISKYKIPSTELLELQQAVDYPDLFNGWPDAGRVEMKIGTDYIKANQWVRFAWLKTYRNVDVQILRAATQEDAVVEKEMFDVTNYIFYNYGDRKDEALILWDRLKRKVSEF